MHPKEQCRLSMEGQSRPDVVARRRARRALDPLSYRAGCAELWKSGPWPFDGVSAWVFFRNRSFRRYLMPGIQSYLNERAAARRARHSADMAESERRWKLAKALKKAQPLPLFEDTP
ncbi:hypothetical protein AVE30378_02535 [Achromobacter veterisilvae]|uniref:Uncharacterized protein n=1 Tax=Achromobacter veterisilvae TaxID=2069367 RepID=A0A446CHH8_9BURK|nr:hypothetical protein [Achromobacter veterisilvae]SSW67268.1 hypothetical protein AVE30378_02535 [Achromobacter veterisilvae]